MDFSFSEELLEIKRIVRDFAEREIRPHVMEWDEEQIFPIDTLKKLADLGFLGVLIPTEYGGAGLGYSEYVAIVEELSRVDGSIGISVAAHNSLCTGHIYGFGNEEQRRRFVVLQRDDRPQNPAGVVREFLQRGPGRGGELRADHANQRSHLERDVGRSGLDRPRLRRGQHLPYDWV